jgi:hypothetical protein
VRNPFSKSLDGARAALGRRLSVHSASRLSSGIGSVRLLTA